MDGEEPGLGFSKHIYSFKGPICKAILDATHSARLANQHEGYGECVLKYNLYL